MSGFKTLDLTQEEALVLKMRKEGKTSRVIAEVLGLTRFRVGHLTERANRKVAVKERMLVQGNRKLRF